MKLLLFVLALHSIQPDTSRPSLLHPPTDTLPDIEVVSPNPIGRPGRILPRDTVIWRGRKYVGKRRFSATERRVLIFSFSAAAGGFWGLHEVLTHRYAAFQHVHPRANPQWWNPAESWRNKYHNRDPEQGRTSVPVQFTDAKHLSFTLHNTALFGAGVCLTLGDHRRKWWQYAIDLGVGLAGYSLGNALVWGTIYAP